MNIRWRRYAIWLILLWIIIIVSIFWLYHFRWINEYPQERWITFADNTLQNPWSSQNGPTDNSRITVVHFMDPDCPCSRFAKPHIQTLEKDFGEKIRFISVDIHSTNKNIRAILQKVPATPSVMIWNTSNQLAYFGPYSSGAFCGEGRDLVRLILNQLENRINPEWIHQEAVGCFCPLTSR